ncbi:hypothetical protein KKB69_01955 [Patescibacteria group bacterium]|nr:hypothetical protein [Patescibacteria group bacterium]
MSNKRKILIIIIALVIVLGPIGIKTSYGEDNYSAENPADVMSNPGGMVKSLLSNLGNVMMEVCSKVLYVAAGLFDASITYSINNAKLTQTGGLVATGWTITRDLANLFFIFILIYIGIATILQISGYGMKELLRTVVIVALLVNFSMLITTTVINATNILANEFYQSMTVNGKSNISEIFAEGLKIQTIFEPKGDSFVVAGQPTATYQQIIIISVFGCAMILITSFVLFAGGLLFLVRSIALQFLILLAPLAFIAMVLPKTKSYASQWWDTLFSQALFAPAFLFLFYLVAKIISEGSYQTLLGTTDASYATAILQPDSNTAALAIQFVTLIILMLGCLTVAKKMGGAGATSAISFATGAKNKMLGYAGAIPRFAARRTIARAGEGIAGSPKMERFVAASPLLGGWTMDKAKQLAGVGGRKEQIETYVQRGMNLPAAERATYLTSLGKGALADKQAQKEMFKKMSARERVELLEKNPAFRSTYDNLVNTLSVEEKEKTGKEYRGYEVKDYINRMEKLTPEEKTSLYQKISPKELNEIAEKGGKNADKIFDDFNQLTENLKAANNKAAMAWTIGPAAQNIKKTRGGEEGTREHAEKEWEKITKRK